jgi:hypothetical protein
MNTHEHRTVAETGACEACQTERRTRLADAPRRFVLEFRRDPRPGETSGRFLCGHCDEWHDAGIRDAIAVIPGYTDNVEDLVETAWAVGANPGGTVGGFEIHPEILRAVGIPEYELIHEPGATAALDAIAVAEDLADNREELDR